MFPFTIDQLTGASHAMICSKISVEPEQGTAMRSAPKPGRIWPSAFSCRNARCGIYGHHSKNFLRRNLRKVLLKNAHLSEQAKAFVTREAVRAEANVKAERAQAIECEWAVTKIVVTSRTVHDVKF